MICFLIYIYGVKSCYKFITIHEIHQFCYRNFVTVSLKFKNVIQFVTNNSDLGHSYTFDLSYQFILVQSFIAQIYVAS